MNIFRFEGERLLKPDETASGAVEEIITITPQQADSLSLPKHWSRLLHEKKTLTHVETQDGLFFLLLNLMEEDQPLAAVFSPGQLILIGHPESSILMAILQYFTSDDGAAPISSGALGGLQLLLQLTADHHQRILEKIEESITLLETRVLACDRAVNGFTFIELRRSLLTLKRHTQPIEEACYLLRETADFPVSSVPALIFRRFNRMNTEISNLENYVTQVRDAYQNHLDLRMNRTMMTLTVLAAVFLPLSLIVGWYGMNFPMPEFSQSWGYGYVIVLSLVSLALSIGYFRRKGML